MAEVELTMCGRFYTDVDREEMQRIINEVNRAIKNREALEQMKTGEIYPTNITPVYVIGDDGATPMLMQWGFPGFPRPGSTAKPRPVINARSETVKEKPTFSRYLNQRCLVPAHRYFEWAQNVKTADGKKPKYAFTPEHDNQSLFFMAGIFKDTKDSSVPVFTILTMDASESVAPIHNRMPVILGSKDVRRAWMQGEQDLAGLFGEGAVRKISYQPAG